MTKEGKLTQIMSMVANQLMNTIQMGIEYAPNWGTEFSYKEILKIHEKSLEKLKEEIGDLKDYTKQELLQLGFRGWSSETPNLLLIPIWAYYLIPDGTELICINGEKKIKGKDYIDMDVRTGCIAYGIELN